MNRHIPKLACAVVGMLLLTSRAIAQADDPSDHSCDKAAKIVAKGHPEKKDQWALQTLVSCAGGAAALATDWSPAPTDDTELLVLAASSGQLADERVLNVVLSAVQNSALPQSTRRIAMNVVLAQYSPTIVVSDLDWADPAPSSLRRNMDYYQIVGEQPITTTDRQRVVATFQAMSSTDPDPQVRRVAAMIARELSRVCGGGKPCYAPAG